MSEERRTLIFDVIGSDVPEIGRALWALNDARGRTREGLEEMHADEVDWMPPSGDSSIGVVLYHIALIEADWLYSEVLEQDDYPPAVVQLFPYSHRDVEGHLTLVQGWTLAEHLERLDTVRQLLLDVFRTMDLDDFRRARHLPQYDVTPEWVLHHLMQHEAEHRSQIGSIRAAFKQRQS